MMEENGNSVVKPQVKNSLLSAAARGFTFEESATLLVPVSLQDEAEKDLPTTEIDLNEEAESVDLEVTFQRPSDDFFASQSSLSMFSSATSLDTSSVASTSSSTVPESSDSTVSSTSTSKPAQGLFSFNSLWSSGRQSFPESSIWNSTGDILHGVQAVLGGQNNNLVDCSSEMDSAKLPVSVTATTSFVPPSPITSSGPRASVSPRTVFSPAGSSFATPSAPASFVPPSSVVTRSGPNVFVSPRTVLPPPCPSIAPPSGAPLTGTKRTNSFRLLSQKPVYAQYPGITGNVSYSPFCPMVAPILTPTPLYAPNNTTSLDYQSQNVEPKSFFTPGSSENTGADFFQNNGSIPKSPSPRFAGNGGTTSQLASSTPNQSQGPSGAFTPYPGVSNRYPTPLHPQLSKANKSIYSPVTHHWFFRKDVDGRAMWKPFSFMDSVALEEAFISKIKVNVATDGGRYDVDVGNRKKIPVYWEESPLDVRRCSWFYKGPLDSRYVPYDEDLCLRLEEEYFQAVTTGVWHKRLEFPGGEAIVLHNPNAMAHFCQAAAPDEWGNLPESQLRPRVVKRGIEEFEIEDGESTQIDHLVFLVHGIGAICDFKFRTIVEAVDDFRHVSFQLMGSHFKEAVDVGKAGKIEFLPVSWHKALHGEGGIDQKLKPITLKSIPKLRNFTNDTLLDILFYTSPVYTQTIVDCVGRELNRLFNLFLSRNPSFNGNVALSGHSLGSLILFDLLMHQPKGGHQRKSSTSSNGKRENDTTAGPATERQESAASLPTESSSRLVSYTIGSGTGQPSISYPSLEFEPTAFFALGSPIAMFATVRGIDSLGEEFHFPTCPSFFNIFHPFDPVAYRMETLIDPNFEMSPILIPHHKGRKRFHLELKETMQRVGENIRQRFVDSIQSTWQALYSIAGFAKIEHLEKEMDRVIAGTEDAVSNTSGEDLDEDVGLGKLNAGRRIDYVLQEAPLESFNEYLFALSSHVCYWESEDTMLMIMREIYAKMGIFVDSNALTQQQANPPADQASSSVATTAVPLINESFPPVTSFSPLVSMSQGQADFSMGGSIGTTDALSSLPCATHQSMPAFVPETSPSSLYGASAPSMLYGVPTFNTNTSANASQRYGAPPINPTTAAHASQLYGAPPFNHTTSATTSQLYGAPSFHNSPVATPSQLYGAPSYHAAPVATPSQLYGPPSYHAAHVSTPSQLYGPPSCNKKPAAPSSMPYGAPPVSTTPAVPPSMLYGAPPFSTTTPAPAASPKHTSRISPRIPLEPPPKYADNKKPTVIGARPVVSPEQFNAFRGMDPTQPINAASSVGPPPLTGFLRK